MMRATRTAGLLTLLTSAALAGMLGGCAETTTSIYHNRGIGLGTPGTNGPRVITVDAKQRHLLMVPEGDESTTGTKWRMCAEASPDAFSAISASASLDADVTAKKAKIAGALAETAGTIERTQTVNLLRESMYRTCERYLSGALDKGQFIVQAARDQRAMVAVLAIEQLTRTARPPAIILAASGTSASVVNGDAAAELIKQFSAEKVAAGAAVTDADGKYKAALTAGKCDTITTAPAADATGPTLGEWSGCEAAKATLASNNKELDAATERLDKVIDVSKAAVSTTSASTTAGTSQNGQGGGAPSDAALKAVADAVTKIAMSPNVDESLMFCIAYLNTPPGAAAPAVIEQCLRILEQRARSDEAYRWNLIDFSAKGAPITIGDASKRSDARQILKDYLSRPVAPEKARRLELAIQAAVALGLIRQRGELTMLVYAGSPEAQSALLEELLRRETSADGRAALKATEN